MKKYLFFYFLFVLGQFSFSQSDSTKRNFPFTFNGCYTGELLTNFDGGIKKGSIYLGMGNLKIAFNTGKAGLWNNGKFFLYAVNTHGGKPSSDLTGDFQIVSNIEAGNLTYLHELWYQHVIQDFSIKVGLQDLNAEFVSSEFAGLFLGSSFGTHSTISSTVLVPIFPLTALGIVATCQISSVTILKIAVFDGYPDDYERNPNNLFWRINSDDGYFAIGEVTTTGNLLRELPLSVKVGAYYHNHYLKMEENGYLNNYGFYLVADQTIIKNAEGREFGLFIQAGISPEKRNENHYYLGAGINCKNLISGRVNDESGVGIAIAGMGGELKNETILECTYKARITENLFIQPDFQYVINPGGVPGILRNAVVGHIRAEIKF